MEWTQLLLVFEPLPKLWNCLLSNMAKWLPRLSERQRQLYDTDKRLVLAVGPRACGKTWSLEHMVLRHAWRNNPSRFAIICKTTRAGSLGVWPELISVIYNEWREAGISSEHAEFGWSTTPRTDPTTKIRYAKLKNSQGGESEILLFPVERSADALEKLLSTQFSGIWISESHLYEDRNLFDVARNQLRLAGVPFKETKLLCDCNPPTEGPAHWLYDVFYRERFLAEEQFPEEWDEATREAFLAHQRDLGVFEFALTDNDYLDPGLAAQIRATYAMSPDDFNRLVLGKWPDRSSPTSVFKGVWDKNIHVVGDVTAPNEADWEVLAPSDGPHVVREGKDVLLLQGWDLGDVNHAWAAIQPWETDDGRLAFDVIDEWVDIGGRISVEDVTKKIVMPQMEALEEMAGFSLAWQYYSDSSAMKFRSSARRGEAIPSDDELTDAAIVAAASGGEIDLIGAAEVKKVGWQRRRVNLLIQLLAERRLRVSAHCAWTIRMFNRLRKDTSSKASTFLAPGQDEKHIFDAVSYPIAMQLIDQLMEPAGPKVVRRMISSH